MPAFILALGLGVDFSGRTFAEQQAREVAAEAARRGAQQLTITPDGAVVDRDQAKTAAAAYLRGFSQQLSDVTATSHSVEVALTDSYRTVFLGLIGVYELPFRVTAEAGVIETIDGQVRS